MDMIAATTTSAGPIALPQPQPRVPVAVRVATAADLPFIDGLQKMHSRMVGWMPTQQLEGKIQGGNVLVAQRSADCADFADEEQRHLNLRPSAQSADESRLGYIIATDRYFKRDDVGIVYQLNVAPSHQRGLVGATLLRAVFERAAYGCRLFCCWCAQDIDANRFWESLGFVPLAFRAGSEKKGRVHIFWQRRIRAGDTTTPWWFPAKTDAGAMREDRLVLPIPPGMRWADEMPVLVPQKESLVSGPLSLVEDKGRRTNDKGPAPVPTPPAKARARFGPPSARPVVPQPPPEPAKAPAVKATRPERSRRKCDPKLVAAARELRDRWLERVNAGAYVLEGAGKYDVSRAALPEAGGARRLLAA